MLETNRPHGTMTGGRALAEMLRLADAGPMFGMGGFQLLPFYDSIRRLNLTHYLINDERTGIFAADACARLTSRVGFCDATLGPGATNLVTGMVEALNAGTALVVITGDANRLHANKNMTQECRQTDILRPAAKEIIRVEMTSRIPELLNRAIQVATSGRPGPVVLDVPEDVAHGEHDFAASDFDIDPSALDWPSKRIRPAKDDVERAIRLLKGAKRPLLLVGGGIHISRAWQELLAFAEAAQIPVAHTMSGKGSIACTHPLSVGLFGRYSRIANDLVAASDCLVVVGCKLGEIATKRYSLLPRVPVIHIDILAEEFGRTTTPTVALWGDARESLADLKSAIAADAPQMQRERQSYIQELSPRMATWRKEAAGRLESTERPINMARLTQELNNILPEDAILIADGGFAAHWTGLIYDAKRAGRGYLADRGLASIGYGLPGGIGAALAAPGRPVVAVTGDGGFNMTIGDLETARRVGASNLIIVVVNNAASGYIKALQHAMYEGHYQSSDLVEMDYAAIANAMGCRGIRLDNPDDIPAKIREALSKTDRPTVLDVIVTRDPAGMLPAVDTRTVKIKPGDRIA